MTEKNTPPMKIITSILIVLYMLNAVAAQMETAVILKAEAPGTFFIQGEPLKFTLTLPEKITSWKLLDWRGNILSSGSWEGKELTLPQLPNGYYRLRLSPGEGCRSFIVGPRPEQRKLSADSFFALDTANSWLASPSYNRQNSRYPENAREIVAEVARRAGAKMVRERFRWPQCEPEPGKFNWNPEGFPYLDNARLMQQRGIEVSTLFHDTPAWCRGNNPRLPADLAGLYRSCKAMAEAFKGKVTLWEYWNEEDIGFTRKGAWEYAAGLKAACLGFKAGDPDLPVAIGAFSKSASPGIYGDPLMANGAREYFDIFNVHTYLSLADYPEMMAAVREFMKRNGLDDYPVYFTESGCLTEGKGGLDSPMKGCREHSPDQELLIAEFMPKMMIALQNLGVDKTFFFVLTPVNEAGGEKVWGLLRYDYTAKPAVAAFSNLTDRLGDAKYLGRYDISPEIAGHLYRCNDGTQTLVYWLKSPLEKHGGSSVFPKEIEERNFLLPVRSGKYTGTNVFGTPFEVVADSRGTSLTATRMPSYLTGLKGLKPTVPFRKNAIRTRSRDSAFDRTIVCRVELSEDFVLQTDKNCCDIKQDTAALTLQVWNLSEQEKSGSLTVSGGKIAGLPEHITIPSFEKVELPLRFTPDFGNGHTAEFHVTGRFGGKEITPLVVPLISEARQLAASCKIEMPRLNAPENWKANSSGKMTITGDGRGTLSFATEFPPNVDRWVYPEFYLKLPEESLDGAYGVSFEVCADSVKNIQKMLVMVLPVTPAGFGDRIELPFAAPSRNGVWEPRIVRFHKEQIDPAKIGMIRIGLNSRIPGMTYRIRNFRVLRPR